MEGLRIYVDDMLVDEYDLVNDNGVIPLTLIKQMRIYDMEEQMSITFECVSENSALE